MLVDPLSDVLKKVRLTGATFFNVRAATPWVAEQAPRRAVLGRILPDATHLIAYHLVSEGSCFAGLIGGEPVGLEAGDVIVFTNGDAHAVSSAPGMRADPELASPLALGQTSSLPYRVDNAGDGPVSAKLVCGFLACDAQPFNPLLSSLPQVMIVKGAARGAHDDLGLLVQLAVREASEQRIGGESFLAKLSELLFVEIVRRYVAGLPADQVGWLAGLRDISVSRAMALMHGSPERAWTVGEVAKSVGVSRSVLFERFTTVVGLPPMQYLVRWRMQIATGLLRDGTGSMSAIAGAVGYASEEAFSRAFKKAVGIAPSAWRRAHYD